MYKIAIVEDEFESVESLKSCLEEYTAEYGIQFNIVHFKNGLNFIEEYKPDFDIVFMDINMPQMNGLNVAKGLRKIDSTVTLIFVTVLAKYAIRGYEVDALDYILKPVNYNSLKIKIDRALARCLANQKKVVMLSSQDGDVRMELSEINYVEIDNHDIYYHTSRGVIKAYGTMRAIEKILPSSQFFRCNRCYLVNLNNVTRLRDNYVYVGNEKVLISRPRKKLFLNALRDFTFSDI